MIHYTVIRTLPPPPLVAGTLATYEVAGNGVFYHAARPLLEARVLVAPALVRGLPPLAPFVHLQVPKVPRVLWETMLATAREQQDARGPLEVLFHLLYVSGRWEVQQPAQQQTPLSVIPLETGPDSTYERAIIEVHSHHRMPAFYSATDAADDRWFRFNVVLGHIFTEPEILVRLGVDGYQSVVVATTICEQVPAGWHDVSEVVGIREEDGHA